MTAERTGAMEGIRLQVMWDRLLAIVEEQAQTLMRTAFSTVVRECGDLSTGFFDTNGQMLAQAVTGTPGHVNSMAMSVGHFLRRFPLAEMRDGDVFITNDPWHGTGHLNDFVVVTPVFRRDIPIGLFASTSHMNDVGGIGFVPDATDLYMEGVRIPITRLVSRGRLHAELVEIIVANSRLPRETEGDLHALIACNEVGLRRLKEMLDELQETNCDRLGEHIIAHSRRAVEREIRALPAGEYTNRMTIDGFERPIDLIARLSIADGRVAVDFAGTSGASRYGINVPLAYTSAYTCYGLAVAVAPLVPNNAGSLAAYSVNAPVGSILNAVFPMPVSARHVVGQMLPDLVFGCLADLLPDRIPAESTSCTWSMRAHGPKEAGSAETYTMSVIMNGGTGARPQKDGLPATSFPSGVRCTPIEVAEANAPVLFWRKEYRIGSGGAGKFRGGDGLAVEMEVLNGLPFEARPSFDRIGHPARGRHGGRDGAPGYLGLSSGRALNGMGRQHVEAGERIVMLTPGGGGYGDPADRNPELVRRDAEAGPRVDAAG